MATVYLARLDISGGFAKWVAVKTIHPHIATTPRFVSMFLDEARLAARLNHPNLCTVFDFGESDGTWFIAMEYLHGETLGVLAREGWIHQSPPPHGLVVRVLSDAARGLHSAHELKLDTGENAGVVHRDVSPENIFVTYDGSAKVVDFGVARSRVQSLDRTATGELKGKVAYMSPEQLRNATPDRRTDVWALGVVLWEVTVGRRLFRRKTDAATVLAVMQDAVPDPRRFHPDYPPGLVGVLRRALDRDPSKRFQTALEFARALESWAATEKLTTDVDSVAAYMHQLFSEQIKVREELLRAASVDAPLEAIDTLWNTRSGNDAALAAEALRETLADEETTLHSDRPSSESLEPVIPLTRSTSRPPEPAITSDTQNTTALPSAATSTLAPTGPFTVSSATRRRRTSLVFLSLLAVAVCSISAAILFQPAPAPTQTSTPTALSSQPTGTTQGLSVVIPSAASQHLPSPAVPVLPVVHVPSPVEPYALVDAAVSRVPAHRFRRRESVTPQLVLRGYLTFTSSLPARVYEGSRELGTTPITDQAFAPGTHAFRFVSLRDNTERVMSVEVSPGGSAVVQARF